MIEEKLMITVADIATRKIVEKSPEDEAFRAPSPEVLKEMMAAFYQEDTPEAKRKRLDAVIRADLDRADG